MRDAFSRAVVGRGVFAGQVWIIPDDLLNFADSDPSRRSMHRSRPVVVVQGDDHGRNQDCPTVLVMPLSSNISNKRIWEDAVTADETPLDAPSIVKVHLIQPIARSVLIEKSTYIGEISGIAMARIMSHLVANLGLIPPR